MQQSLKTYSILFFLSALIYMPLFGHLEKLPIRIYDESRNAMNAYEMYKNGDFVVTHYAGKPDLWNTKPPFLIWCQAMCMNLFGVGELAVRLPAALAALGTCIALLVFSTYYFKNIWFGFIAVLVLVTSQGYITVHGSRTGDFDVMVCLFTTLSSLFLFSFSHKQEPKFLYLFFLCLSLAVLSKSIVGLLFLPAIAIYILWKRQLLLFLKSKHFYFGILLFLWIVSSFYLLREWKSPGYLNAVYNNELGGRFNNTVEQHSHGFLFYYNRIISLNYSYWIGFLLLGLLGGISSKQTKIRSLSVFLFLLCLSFFIIISSAKTKLVWYDLPLYPFFALLVSVFFYCLYERFKSIKQIKKYGRYAFIPIIALSIIFIIPYKAIIEKVYHPKERVDQKDFYQLSYLLQDTFRGNRSLQNYSVVYKGYHAHILFYLKALEEKGQKVGLKEQHKLKENDKVIVSQSSVEEFISNTYDYAITAELDQIKLINIYGRK